MAQKGNIGVTTENIFPVIKKFLYSDHDIFLREMVSNAVDATQKLKTLAAQGDFKGEIGDTTVRISLDEKAGTLTISDRVHAGVDHAGRGLLGHHAAGNHRWQAGAGQSRLRAREAACGSSGTALPRCHRTG